MSHGLFIPSQNGEGVSLSCRFRWPRGDRAYRYTVRAAFYRAQYVYPRLFLWFCVVVPPVVAGRFLLPSDVWSLAQRLVADAALVAVACFTAWGLDAGIFGEIFEGQAHDPDSPALSKAAQAGYEWRRQWAEYEGVSPSSPSDPFAGPLRFTLPSITTETHDLTTLVQGLGREAFLQHAAWATREFIHMNPGTVARQMAFNGRPGVLVLVPIAWEMDVPELATAHIWLVISEPDTAHPGAVLRTGVTYWFPGGKLPDGSTGEDDAAIATKRVGQFARWDLLTQCLLTLFVWPIGVAAMAVEAWRERRHHERYQGFLLQHSPGFGDSLDLLLIQLARARLPHAFSRMPDEFTKRSQLIVGQFQQLFSGTMAGASKRNVR